VVVAAMAFFGLSIPSIWFMVRGGGEDLGADGIIAGDKSIVVLDPERWIGKQFALLRYIDIGEQLKVGRWKVVLYHHDCPKCQALIAERFNADRAIRVTLENVAVALIEMPPYGPNHGTFPDAPAHIARGKLTERHEWFAAAPVEVELADGRVVAATSGGD